MTETPGPVDAGTASEFVEAMRRRRNATGLTYRELERRAEAKGHTLPRSTLTSVLSRTSLPREELVTAFVLACDGDEDEVGEWLAARRRLTAGDPAPAAEAPARPRRTPFWLGIGAAAVAIVVAVVLSNLPADGRTTAPVDGTITTAVVEDTYITQLETAGTRGHMTQLRTCGHYCDKPVDGDGERRILLKYRVDGLPTGACVRNAAMKMWAKVDNDPATVFTVHDVGQQSWDEHTASWAAQPPVGEALATHAGGPGGQWMSFDVTAAVHTSGVHAFAVYSTGIKGGYFAAKEDTTLNHPAELVVEYTRCSP